MEGLFFIMLLMMVVSIFSALKKNSKIEQLGVDEKIHQYEQRENGDPVIDVMIINYRSTQEQLKKATGELRKKPLRDKLFVDGRILVGVINEVISKNEE